MGKVGRFGIFGGQYVPETVMNAVHELEEAYAKYGNDPEFLEEYRTLLRDYAGRPSMLYYADRMTRDLGGCKIYLKREDLNHTGAHKINNVLGQILLAKKMGKKRIIAETGAGQHGVATATACAMFDMECEIDSAALLAQKGYCLHWQREGVCNTGDTFLTELSDVKGDVVDMEAYAQAWVCRTKNTPFIAVKYVTDIIGQNSVKHWEDKLADARKGLGAFFESISVF